jgi:putative addiction module component (TIGR02574 family)
MNDIRDIFKLPLAERIKLAQDLWDSVADETENFPLTEEQQQEIERRLAELDANPSDVSEWSEVRERLWSGMNDPPAEYRTEGKVTIDSVLENVRSWPLEDREELAEIAREIEARRTGVYVLTEDERRTIEAAEREPIVPEAEVVAFWKKHGIS